MAEAVTSINEGLAYIIQKENRQAVASWLHSANHISLKTRPAASDLRSAPHTTGWMVEGLHVDVIALLVRVVSPSKCACFTRLPSSKPCSDRYVTASGVRCASGVPARLELDPGWGWAPESVQLA